MHPLLCSGVRQIEVQPDKALFVHVGGALLAEPQQCRVRTQCRALPTGAELEAANAEMLGMEKSSLLLKEVLAWKRKVTELETALAALDVPAHDDQAVADATM